MGAPPNASAAQRTALSWQRTALSLLGGSAVLTRLTIDRLGSLALLTAACAVPLCLWVFLESTRRYAASPPARPWPRASGGRAPAALVVAIATMAGVELAALLT